MLIIDQIFDKSCIWNFDREELNTVVYLPTVLDLAEKLGVLDKHIVVMVSCVISLSFSAILHRSIRLHDLRGDLTLSYEYHQQNNLQ